MTQLFVLNQQKALFSAYAKDKSIVFTSYDSDKMKKIQLILNSRYEQTRTWTQKITHVYMYAENNIQINLTDNNYCTLSKTQEELQMTFFDTENETDMLFVYQLRHLMNTHVFVVQDLEYDNDIPLLSLNGLFVEYNPPEPVIMDQTSYLNASLSL